ncbi:GNAT family N-acetyltransferase [Dermatobacter hominis]|uniref:GNAT family N-acetyltransferase n=1 Tax=Dermatobacter hominis TaxID=2884263 RepID=UPI001D104810|nr:GNAT family N-acetyltransferase [Dermatobacter hominis]UDY37111.1 GNAT family N-acetyltransferase [Dermatobacter hominis]
MGSEPAAAPEICTLRSLADGPRDPHERFCTVDGLAFGLSNSRAYVEAKRHIMETDRFVLAVVDGVDAGASGNFPFQLTLPGGAHVRVAGVGDVGVLTSHRRRGILRSMVDWLLEDAAARGEVASLLTASQATIYGRFGYGMAVPMRTVEIPVTAARLRDDAPRVDGTLLLHDVAVDRDELLDLLPAIHDRCAASGTLSRSDEWWGVVLGDAETYVGGHPSQRALVHHAVDGTPDGYALYRHDERWGVHGSDSALEVREVVGMTPAVELALWTALLEVDLVTTVRAPLPAHHLLDDVLVDQRALRCTSLRDHIWLRPIDVAALLGARTYAADGVLTLSIDDAVRPGSGGTFRLQVDGGSASCERVSPAPLGPSGADLSMSVADLGARVLGAGSFRAVARAGRIQGDADALAQADAMFDADPPPWTDTKF